MPISDDAPDLAIRLTAAGYTVDAVAERLGERAMAALSRNTTRAARDALGDATDPQATLIRMFLLQDSVSATRLAAAVGDLLRPAQAGLWEIDGAEVTGTVEIRPYASTGQHGEHVPPGSGSGVGGAVDGWVVHHRIPTLDGRVEPSRADFVLGLSPASTSLTEMTIRTRVGTVLDLGTGCGVQSLHLAGHADRVIATDLNPRALELARWTAGLNGIDLDLRLGSLYEPVSEERFDLIVTNPPYVIAPPTDSRLVYREGLLPGDELMREVVTGGGRRLAPGGHLQVLGNWAITESEPWEERLTRWVAPTGCDALILERERLDPYEYIEIWLADAGLLGTAAYSERYAAWVDYFRTLGITSVGLGWITLHAAGADLPDIRCESWPHAVHQPVGPAFASYDHGMVLARMSDADLAATTLVIDPGVAAETLGQPGAADPEHLVLRQRYGFGRAVEVNPALAGVVGACDGDLAVGSLIAAVADLLDLEVSSLTQDLLPQIRRLAREGYLHQPETVPPR
ncbi:MAG: methyltransferase [Propioniciclava sp.]